MCTAPGTYPARNSSFSRTSSRVTGWVARASNFAAAPADIVKGGREVPPMDCNEGPRSRFPNGPAFNAILQNLDLWVRKGVPAPQHQAPAQTEVIFELAAPVPEAAPPAD